MLRVAFCSLFLAFIAVTLALPRVARQINPMQNPNAAAMNTRQMCPKTMPMSNNMLIPANMGLNSQMGMMMQLSGDMPGTMMNPSGELDIMQCRCALRPNFVFRFPALGKRCLIPGQRCFCGDTGVSVEGDQAVAYNMARHMGGMGHRGARPGARGMGSFMNPLLMSMLG